VAINDALPPKAARRDAIAKLKSLLGLRIRTADKSNAVSWDATLMPLTACAIDWGRNRIHCTEDG